MEPSQAAATGWKQSYNCRDDQDKIFNCYKCDKQHKIRDYPAYGKECKVCTKLNHFAVKCKNNRRVDMVECESHNAIFEWL